MHYYLFKSERDDIISADYFDRFTFEIPDVADLIS